MQNLWGLLRFYAGGIMTNGQSTENKGLDVPASDNQHYVHCAPLRDYATHRCGHEVDIIGATHAELRYQQRTASMFDCIPCELTTLNPHAQPISPSQPNQDAPQAYSGDSGDEC